MISGSRLVQKKDGKKDQAKTKERKKGLLEKDPIGNGLMKRPHGKGSSVYLMDSKTTPISSKKDEIKEGGSSKEAAKMLNRAINSSDVTQADTQPFVFSCRPERWDINTMTVERGKILPQHMKVNPKKSKTGRSTSLNILRNQKQNVFGYDEISKVADTDKARHLLSAQRYE